MLIFLRWDICAVSWTVFQFAGRWYRVGLAYDSPGFVRHRNKLIISVGTVEPKENGSVNMTMWSLRWRTPVFTWDLLHKFFYIQQVQNCMYIQNNSTLNSVNTEKHISKNYFVLVLIHNEVRIVPKYYYCHFKIVIHLLYYIHTL